MNKDIKWLKEELDKSTTGFNGRELSRYEMGRLDGYTHASMLLDELDEQETLSQEWIDRFEQFRAYVQEQRDLSYGVELGATGGYTGRIANQYDGLLEMIEEYEEHNPIAIQKLLVSKPKKPIIPKFVAVWIEETKKQGKSLVFAITHIYYKNEIGKSPNKEEKKIFQWMELDYNEEVFARAWLDGYEVEKEKAYHVVNKENYFMLRKDDGLVVTVVTMQVSPAMSRDKYGKDTRFMLTEKEIKDYDERYWAFAEEVTE